MAQWLATQYPRLVYKLLWKGLSASEAGSKRLFFAQETMYETGGE